MILFLFQLCFTLFCCLFVAQLNINLVNKGLLLSVSESNYPVAFSSSIYKYSIQLSDQGDGSRSTC